MFYALLISLIFMVLIFLNELKDSCAPYIYDLKLWFLNQSSLPCPLTPRDPAIIIDSFIFISFYFISIIALLWRLRYMRFKEVQTVFVASLINKSAIGHYLSDNPLCTQAVEQAVINWNNNGRTLNSQGEHEEAIKAYDKAIEINPQDAVAWKNKAIALKSLGRTAEADAAFAKAKELGYTG
jgi:tetratricopeptide (TPR) repeat protein